MRNFTYLLVSALLAGSTAMAQGLRINGTVVKKSTLPTLAQARKAHVIQQARENSSFYSLSKAPIFKAMPQPVYGDSLITSPEGTAVNNMMRSDVSFYSYFGYLIESDSEAGLGSYVLGADGNIYLTNPLSTLSTEGKLKLTKRNDSTYVAYLPQAIYSEESEDGSTFYAYANRLVAKTSDDGVFWYPDTLSDGTCNDSIVFSYKDGELSQADQSQVYGYPYEMLGLTDATGSWYGYGSGNIAYKPLTETVTPIPADTTSATYKFTYNTVVDSTGTEVPTTVLKQVALSKNGKDIYLHDPANDDADLWIHGTISDDKKTISFPEQFLGADSSISSYLWMKPGTATVEYSSSNGSYGYSYEFADKDTLTFTYDAATGSFSLDAPEALIVNASKTRVYYSGAYVAPKYEPFTEVAATPANPKFDSYQAYSESNGYGAVQFEIPSTDVDGNILNTNKLSYNFFVDDPDEPFEFSTDEYTALTENMTEVPYNFSDSWDFYATGDQHTIYFYFDGAEKFGLQSIYRGAGEEHKSDVVWLDIAAYTSVKGIVNNNTKVAKTEMFDITGRKVNSTYKGMVIKKTTFADGSVKTAKLLNK